MKCDEVRRLVDAWFDGELDAVRRSEIERHVNGCPGCDAVYGRRRALRAAVRGPGVRYEAPAGLEQRVRATIRAASPGPRLGGVPIATWLGLAAAAVVIVTGVWAITLFRQRASLDTVAQDVVAAHVRSLLPGHLTDVPSSDQHEVKPWFAGKIDFSPSVPNLDAQGFLLGGGRLDYVGGQSVAAIVYRRRLHVLNVFV